MRSEIEALYRTHAHVVFRRALRILRSEAEAHEIVQDLFLGLFVRPEQLSGRGTVTSFFYAASTHACLNRLRDQRNRARLLRVHARPVDVGGAAAPDVLSSLRSALVRLPVPLAEVAVYAYFDELTQDEISVLLGCSRREVGRHLERLKDFCMREDVVR